MQQGVWGWQVGGIIVSPTRELAKQIHDVAQPFLASVPGLTSALYVGGRCGTLILFFLLVFPFHCLEVLEPCVLPGIGSGKWSSQQMNLVLQLTIIGSSPCFLIRSTLLRQTLGWIRVEVLVFS